MSEKPTEEQEPEDKEQAKPATGSKAAAVKAASSEKSSESSKPAAPKKPAAKTAAAGQSAEGKAKPARAPKASAKPEESSGKKSPAKPSKESDDSVAAKKSTAKKSTAKTPATKTPTKKPVTKKSTAKKSTADGPTGGEPDNAKGEKSSTAARREIESTAGPRRKVVRAQARYVRTSARKARMVCGHLRGKSVPEARAILAFTPREVARDWSKLLESAVANAENNHELVEDDLFVREAFADEGPTIKRFRPRAMGRASPIRKRTSHLTITLTPKP
jgi:ribosomal protein L22